jgi:ketosteroid isomerase-like protein
MVIFEAEKMEIETMLRRIEAAENRRDVDAMFEDMTEDSILHKCGTPQIQGRDAWKKDYEQFFTSGFVSTIITCLGREVSASGDIAWEYGCFVSEFEGPDGCTKSEGKYLGVLKKVDGKWKSAAVSISGNG